MNLARLYNFVAGTAAVADQVDAEFNQLITFANDTAVQVDGSNPFTAVQPGITPVAAGDLATKGYVDGLVGGGAAPVTVRKTVDESLTSSAVFQPDDHLLFAAAINSIYSVEILAYYVSTVAFPLFGILLPAGATMLGEILLPSASNVGLGSATGINKAMFTEATNMPAANTTLAAPAYQLIRLTAIVNTGATAGNVSFQWRQQTGNATPVTVKANSLLTYQKLA